MFEIKILSSAHITPQFLLHFHHRQEITEKWVKRNHTWQLVDSTDLREWDAEKRLWIPEYLREQIARGGTVAAAYENDTLVGFGCLDGVLAGQTAKHTNLTMLFVDDTRKRQGIGTTLFAALCTRAAAMGADKLFISAIPSAETVAFYFNLGCVDANEHIPAFLDTEEDRPLEYILAKNHFPQEV